MRLKPMLATASRIHSAKGGVKASHALEDILSNFYLMFMLLQNTSTNKWLATLGNNLDILSATLSARDLGSDICLPCFDEYHKNRNTVS